jgi:hypothetical protein
VGCIEIVRLILLGGIAVLATVDPADIRGLGTARLLFVAELSSL